MWGRGSDLRGGVDYASDREIMSQTVLAVHRCSKAMYGKHLIWRLLLIMFDKIQVLQATDTLLSAFP